MRLGMIRLAWIGAVVAVALTWGQSRHKVDINAETPEGQLLQQIGQEQDASKQVGLIEQYLSKHGSHAGVPWAHGQMVAAAKKANQFDKVLPSAETLLTLNAADAEMAYAGLEAAVGKKDAALTSKWARSVVDACKKASAAPEPKEEDEIERWKYRVTFCKEDQAPKRAEYEVAMAGQNSPDPAAREAMADALLALNPKSSYLGPLQSMALAGYRQAGQNDKALAFAAKFAAADAADEDMLLILTYTAFEKKEQDNVVKFADQLAAHLREKPAPAGADAAVWEKKKGTTLGAGLWFKGMSLAAQSKWKETDTTLREALPLVQDNADMNSHALFNIAFANYKMGNGAEALKFNQQCAAVKGPKQAEAAKNATVLRSQGVGTATPKKAGAAKK